MSVVHTHDHQVTVMTEWIATVADLMDLQDWKIVFNVAQEPRGEGAAGEIGCCYGRKVATMLLSSALNDPVQAAELRHVVVHELVHCHLDTLDNAVQNDLDGLLSDDAHKLFHLSFSRDMEYATDALATSLAKFMPMPPKGVFKKNGSSNTPKRSSNKARS